MDAKQAAHLSSLLQSQKLTTERVWYTGLHAWTTRTTTSAAQEQHSADGTSLSPPELLA